MELKLKYNNLQLKINTKQRQMGQNKLQIRKEAIK